jgi:hypothetical protein
MRAASVKADDGWTTCVDGCCRIPLSVIESIRDEEERQPTTICRCGCGEPVTRWANGRQSVYAKGHSPNVRKPAEARIASMETKLCECGCGKVTKRFNAHGSEPRFAHPGRPRTQYAECQCGCGVHFRVTRTNKRFAPGHKNRDRRRERRFYKTSQVEEAIRLYRAGMSGPQVMCELSARYGAGPVPTTLHRWMKARGVPKNQKFTPSIRAEAVRLYVSGLSLREVERVFQLQGEAAPSHEMVGKWVRAAGVARPCPIPGRKR